MLACALFWQCSSAIFIVMEHEDRRLCQISLPKGGLDNDYTIYTSGRIHYFYDRHIYPGGQNEEEWLIVSELNEDLKKRLIERCPKEHVGELKKLFKS